MHIHCDIFTDSQQAFDSALITVAVWFGFVVLCERVICTWNDLPTAHFLTLGSVKTYKWYKA